MLESLAKSRSQNKGWRDAEEEVSGTQVFKIGEALRPFYLVAAQGFEPPIEIHLEKSDLAHDTRAFFSIVAKHGFFPSPYSAVASADQYIDFAAFTLDFADLVLRYPSLSGPSGESIRKSARSCLQKALEFLTNPKNYLEDGDGVRWAGTTSHSRTLKKGKVTERFTDTYFTANAILALNRAREIKTIPLPQDKKAALAELIRKAGRWIAKREKQGLLTGDEERDNQQLFYTTWGIRALAETYHDQDAPVRDLLKAVSATYIETLDKTLDEKGVTVTQNYIYVFSTDLETQLPYEERTSWAGVLLALASLARVQELEPTLEASRFSKVLDAVFNGMMALRDPVSDLWYREYFIISVHSFLAEALIRLSGLPPRLGFSYEVTSALVDRAVQEALADSRCVKLVQQLFYEKMSRLASRREQEKTMSHGLNQISPIPVAEFDSKTKRKAAGGKQGQEHD